MIEKSYYSTAKRKTKEHYGSGLKIEKEKMYIEIPEEICKIFEKQSYSICGSMNMVFDVDKKGNVSLRPEF